MENPMVEQERLSSQQVEAYLERLGLADAGLERADVADAPTRQAGSADIPIGQNCLDDAGLCDLATLNILVYAHQCSIPFESMGMYRTTTPPDLTLGTLFDKIVTRKRGGYCFELNRLFMMLLTRLGFSAYAVFGRIKRPGGERLPITHRGTIIEFENNLHYVDVGFGGPIAAGALVLENDKKQRIGTECYRMRRIDSTWWGIDRIVSAPQTVNPDRTRQNTAFCPDRALQSTEDAANGDFEENGSGECRHSVSTEGAVNEKAGEALCASPKEQISTVMEICTARAEEQDFDALNLWCSQPGARFRETMVANIRTQTGYYGIDNNTLVICENGRKEQFPLATEEELRRATKTYFGFEL